MRYSIGQLSNQRWGIYCDDKLLASIGCYQSGLQILACLETKTKHSRQWKMVTTSSSSTKIWHGDTFSKLGVEPKTFLGKKGKPYFCK